MTIIVPRRRATRHGLGAFCASVLCVLAGAASAAGIGPVEGGAVPQPVPEFPSNNWWNTDISDAPVDPASAKYIKFINNGSTRHLHPDFGGDVSPSSVGIYGFPYAVVDGTQPVVAVQFHYSDQSDGVNHDTDTSFPFYPVPTEAIAENHWIECGDAGTVDKRSKCDRHLLMVDRDNKYLYELYNVWYDGSQWRAGSGAFFDMTKNGRRPNGWTSADAAGLAIFPGLVRYDEVYNAYGTNVTNINHAFRMTVRATKGFVYPASHNAGSTTGALPMGARLRLKASKDISGFTPEMQKIFRAMKTYGLIVADNGSDMYISGTYDTNWDNDILNPAFAALSASDFQVIELGWKPPLNALTVSPNPVAGGNSTTGRVTLQDAAPTSGAVVALSATGVLTAPSTVTVPSDATFATFSVTTGTVTATQNPTITGTYDGSKQKVVVTVVPPPKLHALTVNPVSITGAGTATGTVTLTQPAPAGGATVTLTSSDPATATVPASVKLAKDATQASFNITAMAVTAKTTVTISATYAAITRTASFTVKP